MPEVRALGFAVAAVEVYTRRTNIPGQYAVRPETCGAVLLWSRFRFGRRLPTGW